MKRAAIPNRRVGFWGAVITVEDDEPASEQPVTKSVKMEVLEESAPDLVVTEPRMSEMPVEKSSISELEAEVAELIKKLQKKEDMLQRACRYSRKTELRAERAENLLESKHGILESVKIMEELKKRVTFLTAELEMERRKANEDRERDRQRIDELTRQLGQYKGGALEGELQQLQQSPQAQLPSEESQLYLSPHSQQLQPPEDQEEDDEEERRIDELIRELAAEKQLEVITLADDEPAVKKPSEQPCKVFTLTQDPAILQLWQSDTLSSISLDNALSMLRPSYERVEKKLALMTIFKCSKCDLCAKSVRNIIGHFFSEEHTEKVRASSNSVSIAAVQHWHLELLQAAASADVGSLSGQI